MGGEESPQLLFRSVLEASKQFSFSDKLFAIASPEVINELAPLVASFERGKVISFIPAEEVISMDEMPLLAIRRKKRSSLALGISLLKDESLDAFITTGNTGALVALSVIELPLLPNVERPALLATVPSCKGHVAVLDVGANIQQCSYKNLIRSAWMGIAYQRYYYGIDLPRVGLLNIGVEAGKGTKQLQLAYQKMKEYASLYPKKFSFLGNIEGREVFQGKVDVLVTDGFTGNVFLKTSEGVSEFIVKRLMENFAEKEEGTGKKLANLVRDLDYAVYPGAILCGVSGVVVKCHGYSGAKALKNGVLGAYRVCQMELISKMSADLSSCMCE